MTETERPTRTARNGVDVPTLFATLDAVEGQPATSPTSSSAPPTPGSAARTTARAIQGFYGAGQEDTSRTEPFVYDADHPAVLVGTGQGPDAGRVPAARASRPASPPAWRTSPPPAASPCTGSSPPSRATSTCSASSGCPTRCATATSRSGSASTSTATPRADELQALVEQSRRRSAVYDVLTNGTDRRRRRRSTAALRPGRTGAMDAHDHEHRRRRRHRRRPGRPRGEPPARRVRRRPRRARARPIARALAQPSAWDSLRLLTPNWMSRLPGCRLHRPGPGRLHDRQRGRRYLRGYAAAVRRARSSRTPTCWRCAAGATGSGDDRPRAPGRADAVVLATGWCDLPSVPAPASALDPRRSCSSPRRRTATRRRCPTGGVLVVGASASGAQLADELAAAGREVVLAVGSHTRCRGATAGRDIMWWLDAHGRARPRLDASRPGRAVAEPSLQLAGHGDAPGRRPARAAGPRRHGWPGG